MPIYGNIALGHKPIYVNITIIHKPAIYNILVTHGKWKKPTKNTKKKNEIIQYKHFFSRYLYVKWKFLQKM